MRHARFLLLCAIGLTGVACGAARTAQADKQATAPNGDTYKVATWQPAAGQTQYPIWPGNPPDGTYKPQPPERLKIYDDPPAPGGRSEAVLDIAIPTMTVIRPKGPANGTAVVVFPGGGFQMVFIDLEGTEICRWLVAKGVTCIVSKYRAPGGNNFWDGELKREITPKIPRALQDAQRTIRLVRSRATEFGIDPHRIGVMGFSAGGYLVAQTSNVLAPTYKPVDAIDRISSRPDFAVALYPGHICRNDGKTFDPTLPVTKAAPPTFIAQAWDDPVDPVCNSLMYAAALDKAGVSVEIHLFAKGGHAFGLRKKDQPVGAWPLLVERWMKQIGML